MLYWEVFAVAKQVVASSRSLAAGLEGDRMMRGMDCRTAFPEWNWMPSSSCPITYRVPSS